MIKPNKKKFKGEVCSSSTSQQGAPSIKLEPAFLVENEEAVLAVVTYEVVDSVLNLGIDQER